MLIGLWVGVYFARTKQATKHKNMQTTIVLIQPFFILFSMVVSYYNYVILGETTGDRVARLMMLHGSLGLAAVPPQEQYGTQNWTCKAYFLSCVTSFNSTR